MMEEEEGGRIKGREEDVGNADCSFSARQTAHSHLGATVADDADDTHCVRRARARTQTRGARRYLLFTSSRASRASPRNWGTLMRDKRKCHKEQCWSRVPACRERERERCWAGIQPPGTGGLWLLMRTNLRNSVPPT